MSLYNQLFGQNPMSDILLTMLKLTREDTGRFRDCYLTKWGGETEAEKTIHIAVFTRNGGGNREEYEGTNSALQAHPLYVRDFDDDFDSTYATFVFKVPEQFKDIVKDLYEAKPDQDVKPMEKFRILIEKMQSGDKNDPEVQRAMEVGKKIFGGLSESLEKGGVTIIKV